MKTFKIWVLISKNDGSLMLGNNNQPLVFNNRAAARNEAFEDELVKSATVTINEVDWSSK